MDNNDLLTADEAAKIFSAKGKKICARTVYNYMEKHGLPYTRYGKNGKLVRREDVLNFVRPKWGKVSKQEARKPAQ